MIETPIVDLNEPEARLVEEALQSYKEMLQWSHVADLTTSIEEVVNLQRKLNGALSTL